MTGQIADGMHIDWDVAIPMEDGIVLRADVFRPIEDGRYPIILSYEMAGVGPFAHDRPVDRPREIFAAEVTLHFDPGRPAYVQLPVIPVS